MTPGERDAAKEVKVAFESNMQLTATTAEVILPREKTSRLTLGPPTSRLTLGPPHAPSDFQISEK